MRKHSFNQAGERSWQRRTLAATVLMLVALAGCGYNNNNNTTSTGASGTAVSQIKRRAFVSNQTVSFGANSGLLNIVDAEKDQIGVTTTSNTTGTTTSFSSIQLGFTVPTFLVLTPDKTKTLVVESTTKSIDVIDNKTESVTATIPFVDNINGVVMLPDNKTGFASQRSFGAVTMFDLSTSKSNDVPISVPTVRGIVLNHNGKTILAFSDDVDTVNVIDTASQVTTPVHTPQLDRPIYGVFSSDDSKAFILNCGPECGGRAASVTVLDMATLTLGPPTPVSAATVGLLDGTNLYVAGTQGTAGKLDVINTSTLAVTKSGVAISDGFHSLMVLGSNNKLFVGSQTCTNQTSGCLTIFDTSAQTAVIDAPKGGVTGMQPISGRSIVYVCEGGELRIYNTTTSTEQTSPIIDIIGKAFDVKAIDQ